MLTETACQIINHGVCFMPGWKITAHDFTTRHEGCVALHVEYPGRETARSHAPEYATCNEPRAVLLLQVGNFTDDLELHRAVIGKLIEFWVHEAREFYRVLPSMWAPFHPHKIDGMERWGEPDKDLTYGFNAMRWEES